MDKLRAMGTFVAIADAGSLTRAASVLSSSPATVTRALAALEADLGVRLLARTTRRIALTDEGRAYLDRARVALAAVDDADGVVSGGGEPRGRVVVTAPVLFGRMVVTPMITRFLAGHPQMQISLQLFDRVVNLLDEGIDVGVRIGTLDDSSLVAVTVGRIRRVVVASPAYLKRCGTPKRPKDLLDHNCLAFTGSSAAWWTFHDGKKKVAVPVRGNLECNHVGPAIDACTAGAGIGTFLSYQVAPRLIAGDLTVLLEAFEAPPRPVNVVVPSNRGLPLRTRAVFDALVADMKRLRSPFASPAQRRR
jgi:DNA-binding transcriptional LysR family regulator